MWNVDGQQAHDTPFLRNQVHPTGQTEPRGQWRASSSLMRLPAGRDVIVPREYLERILRIDDIAEVKREVARMLNPNGPMPSGKDQGYRLGSNVGVCKELKDNPLLLKVLELDGRIGLTGEDVEKISGVQKEAYEKGQREEAPLEKIDLVGALAESLTNTVSVDMVTKLALLGAKVWKTTADGRCAGEALVMGVCGRADEQTQILVRRAMGKSLRSLRDGGEEKKIEAFEKFGLEEAHLEEKNIEKMQGLTGLLDSPLVLYGCALLQLKGIVYMANINMDGPADSEDNLWAGQGDGLLPRVHFLYEGGRKSEVGHFSVVGGGQPLMSLEELRGRAHHILGSSEEEREGWKYGKARVAMQTLPSCSGPKSTLEKSNKAVRALLATIERSRAEQRKAPLCKYAVESKQCPFGTNCKFSHNWSQDMGAPPRSSARCRFDASGEICRFGAACRFSHGVQSLPCRYHAVGMCNRGFKCNFSHAAPISGSVTRRVVSAPPASVAPTLLPSPAPTQAQAPLSSPLLPGPGPQSHNVSGVASGWQWSKGRPNNQNAGVSLTSVSVGNREGGERCWDFGNNNCWRGESCKFAHVN